VPSDDDAVWELMMGDSDGDDDDEEEEAIQVSSHMNPELILKIKGSRGCKYLLSSVPCLMSNINF